jgi:hypothetical protein
MCAMSVVTCVVMQRICPRFSLPALELQPKGYKQYTFARLSLPQ